MTLLSRLAQRSNAQVLFCIAERLPRARGWKIHFIPANSEVSSKDGLQATSVLNEGVEQCVALCPSQYLWDYKRFSTMEDGTRRRYK